MSKKFRVLVTDERSVADELKKKWQNHTNKSIEGSTIFHEFTVTDVETKDEAFEEVLKIIEDDVDYVKIKYIEEIMPDAE